MHHDRHLNVIILGQAIPLKHQVQNLLAVFGNQKNPAGVPGGDHVLLAGRHGDDPRGLPVHVDHDHGSSGPGRRQNRVIHEHQAP